jgi:hypothetical protein
LLGNAECTALTGSGIRGLAPGANEWTEPASLGYYENNHRHLLEVWEKGLVSALADLVMADLLQSKGGRFS